MALKLFFFFFSFLPSFSYTANGFSSKPKTFLFQTTHDPSLQNPKPKKRKKERRKEYLISPSLSLCVCMFPFFFFDLWFSLSLSLSGQNNERGCDDGFVDFKSVEVSGIAENDLFFGLKPNRFGFYFLIFPVWLLRKWWRRVPFLVWNPVDLAFIFWFFDLS